MTPLGRRIAALVEQTGPIGVADYMAMCLLDPEHGYYTTREPFGRQGDFVTAPEISQMFGELVGVWLYSAWQARQGPVPVTVAELGPGRGTLMKDVIRALSRLDGRLAQAARFVLVEASPRLRDVQRRTLAGAGVEAVWVEDVDALPPQPTFLVGNEIFDAIPARQYVRAGRQWRERCVGLDADGRLAFVAGPGTIDTALLPDNAATAAEGAIFETAPARVAMMRRIADRVHAHGGAGLFFDYGHLVPGIGDTLQAVRAHRPEGVLDNPGAADLTTHVDFAALAAAAREAGLDSAAITQGAFLLGMGLLERAGRLGANADEAARRGISAAVDRLAGPDAMGSLFKVLAVGARDVLVHPFDGTH